MRFTLRVSLNLRSSFTKDRYMVASSGDFSCVLSKCVYTDTNDVVVTCIWLFLFCFNESVLYLN